MVVLDHVPEGLAEIESYYGKAGEVVEGDFRANAEWVKENLAVFEVVFPLRQSWDLREIRGFHAHIKVGLAIVDALNEIKDFYGLAYMRRHGLDYYGGVYNPRCKRGSWQPSTHAWGIAIDYCPGLGPMGERSLMPWPIVDAFLRRGFENLPKTDGMHFQACREY